MGAGFCRPDGCDITSPSCRVNGYYKDESSYQECHTTCLEQASCVGFAISESTYSNPNRCYVYVNSWQQIAPSGWFEYAKLYFDIHTSSNRNGVMCYRIGS